MTNREFFLARRAAELPAFDRVLRALPADKMEYKPHERSPSAGQLVWTIAAEVAAACDLAEKGGIDWDNRPHPPHAEMVAAFHRHHGRLDQLVAGLDDAAWARPGQMRSGGKVMLEQPVGEFLWFLLFDGIHHRGQLAAYIRPMGGRVPAIYGPSADSRG